MTDLKRWLTHSHLSDPGTYAPMVAALRDDLPSLGEAIQGVLIHSGWLADYGLEEGLAETTSRETLGIAERLRRILSVTPDALANARPPEQRSLSTCRDFALMLVSFLRSKQVPARLRCGFANYLGGDWEDHWVCEYWDAAAADWRLADPQLDDVLGKKLGIGFSFWDLPRGSFLTADQAWQACRSQRQDASAFGHGAAKGFWFMRVNVVRDHYALNNREISIWDGWRSITGRQRDLAAADLRQVDALALAPERAMIEVVPD